MVPGLLVTIPPLLVLIAFIFPWNKAMFIPALKIGIASVLATEPDGS